MTKKVLKKSLLTEHSDADTCDTDSLSKTPLPAQGAVTENQSFAAINQVNLAENLLIFDWDDTLFPTSFITRQGLKLDGQSIPAHLQVLLDDYAEYVKDTLFEAQRYGTVILVTNAETGWIDLTTRKFLPTIAREVMSLRQISARSIFEPQGVKTPFGWKEHAFRMVIDEHYSDFSAGHVKHVISFGDSAHERDAVIRVCADLSQQPEAGKIRCKSLKFMERPDLDQMKKEHNLIRQCLSQILHVDSLDLCIQTSPGFVSGTRQTDIESL
jgi:hypothetical protein